MKFVVVKRQFVYKQGIIIILLVKVSHISLIGMLS
jgi:hypothetical protein